jgi:tripartite-type tricarboxylate transporter receptor subunit TctC
MCAASAHAQSYPTKPVRVIVPYAAGGSVDLVARMIGQKLGEALGQQFVVDNRAGVGGNIGTEYVARAAADGHTLLVGTSNALAVIVHLFTKLPFDSLKDFAPIILLVNQPSVLVVHPSVPAKTFKEFVALTKANPGKYKFGSSGVGATQHMSAEMLMMMTGAKVTHIPYKGGAPALNDLVGGHIDFMFAVVPTTIPMVQSGKVRALAVTSDVRSGMLPDVPTMQEAGLPGFEVSVWQGLYVPKGTPKPVIDALVKALQTALANPTLGQRFADLGTVPATKEQATPEALRAHLKAEIDKWAPIIRKAGVYAD